jgi:hypothetical protein
MRLREAGVSYDKIAEAVGYRDRSGAHKAVMAGLKAEPQESATNLRHLELIRLDKLMFQLWPLATGKPPDQPAIDRILKIMQRRAALTGLDKTGAKGEYDVDDGKKVVINWDELYDQQASMNMVDPVEERIKQARATKVESPPRQSNGQLNPPPSKNGTGHD